ncbi:MAG: glycosyltransferase family 9 protein [Catenulispora sp.]
MSGVLAVRLDGMGDVLLAGPAIRALAAGGVPVPMLVGPAGVAAAELLPGVTEVLSFDAPWVAADPVAYDAQQTEALIRTIRRVKPDQAVVFTSFHQSPLPAALLLRMAGVPRISAISVDYPGSLLDVRHLVDDDLPEPERGLSLARAAGFALPDGDDGALAVRSPLPVPDHLDHLDHLADYVVVHPGCTAPARTWPAERWTRAVAALGEAGYRVLVTGGRGERRLTATVSRGAPDAVDLGGRTTLAELAAVLARAQVVVAPNTGPAHLAAAVGTPVVSLFSPVVPAVRWAPYRVPSVLLGDQEAACAGSRARECPVPGHPCLNGVWPEDVVAAVAKLMPAAAGAA